MEKDKSLAAGLLPVGTLVEALYRHVKPREYSAWYRAKIKQVDERRGKYVIDWEDGDKNLRKQPAENVRPLSWGALPQANEGPAAGQTAAKQQQQQSVGTRRDHSANASKGDTVVLVGVERKSDAFKGAETDQGMEATSSEEAADEGDHDAGDMETEGDRIDESARVDEDATVTHTSNRDGNEKARKARGAARSESGQTAINRKKARAERRAAVVAVQKEETDEETDEETEEEEEEEAEDEDEDEDEEEDVERSRRVAWSKDEQNQLRKMLRAGRQDWEAMGACIGLGRTERATRQHALHLEKNDDLKIDKRPAKFTEWKVMSQAIAQEGELKWKTHFCIDAAILERWARAARFRSCPTQTEVEDDPLLCVDIKRGQILKRCMNGMTH